MRALDQRAARGNCGQAAGPVRRATAPRPAHKAAASHHSQAGDRWPQPAARAAPPAAATARPMAQDSATPAWFSRPHSQPAAAMSASTSRAKGQGLSAVNAPSMTKTSTSAVMMR